MIPPNEVVDHAMAQTAVQTGQDAAMTGEPKPGTARCPCCRGTGRILAGPGNHRPTKEEARLRSELIRVWDIAGSLEWLVAGIYETAGEAISSLAADLENAGSGIAERDRLISDLERQLAVHQGWTGDAPGEESGKTPGRKDGQPAMTRDEHRLASARFGAARNGGDPDLITKKRRGAQSGHRVGREGVQASVAETARTTQIRIIPHRYAVTLRSIWGWMEHPPAMRDGTTGYEWHKGTLARCLVRLLRDTEESLMENELGSPRTTVLAGVFSDADNDSLNVTVTSSDATKATVSVSSDHASLTLTAQARDISTITATADDGNGGTVSDIFTVTVKAAPTVSSAIPDVSGLVVEDSTQVSLAGVFDDADGDSLVITAASSNGTVATVEAASDGSALTLTAQAPGTATIRVTAQDADGNRATDTFGVTVDAAQQQTADVPELEPIVAQYDTGGSGIIEQDEWEVAVEDHANGKLTNEEIFAISKARSSN